ncbi:MAG: prepilin-type N-terminal cleavage/methylation domain-containing protein [Phycisphaerales bacterium]|jgi:prepilin-type N-terminal cleavage/methylation domain-containing protein|nr:prepilin-type N-terminal cleavage/methylation domain-containing protein [Phycisphaerales bacterium]
MRRGLTLLELMLVVAILAILGALLMPMAVRGDSVTTDATARLLASDLEHAQMLALSRPDLRVALSIDADEQGWRIVDADAPGVPLTDRIDDGAAGRTLAVRCGEGRASFGAGALVRPGGSLIIFDPLGGLETPGGLARTVQVDYGASTRLVSVDADTGFVTLE